MRWLLVVAALAACTSDRDRDCEIVRDTLGKRDMPRRYYDYEAGAKHEAGDIAIIDRGPLDKLKRMTWRDAEVRAAVNTATESGWTAYAPYSTSTTAPLDKLRALCKLD